VLHAKGPRVRFGSIASLRYPVHVRCIPDNGHWTEPLPAARLRLSDAEVGEFRSRSLRPRVLIAAAGVQLFPLCHIGEQLARGAPAGAFCGLGTATGHVVAAMAVVTPGVTPTNFRGYENKAKYWSERRDSNLARFCCLSCFFIWNRTGGSAI